MQEAFTVLRRAIQDAERRLRQYETEGAKHKLPSVRHAIRDLEEACKWLTWCHGQKLELIKLWNLVEEGNRANVQVPSSSKNKRRQRDNGAK
jgi:hypothetical protein